MSSTSSALVTDAAVAFALVLVAPLLRLRLWLRRRYGTTAAEELAALRCREQQAAGVVEEHAVGPATLEDVDVEAMSR